MCCGWLELCHPILLLMNVQIMSTLCYHEECHYEHPFISLRCAFVRVSPGCRAWSGVVRSQSACPFLWGHSRPLPPPSAVKESSCWTKSLPTFGVIRLLNFASLVVTNLIEVVIWIIFITNVIEHLFICMQDCCLSSSVKFLFLSFAQIPPLSFVYPLLWYVLQWTFHKME